MYMALGYLFFLCVSCSTPKQNKIVFKNDFESIQGWQSVKLAANPVHSGLYSNKLDSVNIYGLTFRLALKDISPRHLKKVKISLWVYFTQNSQASLVVDIDNPFNQVLSGFYTSMGLEQEQVGKWEQITATPAVYSSRSSIREIGKWQEITEEISLQDTALNKPGNVVVIYPWDNGKKDVYVDDFIIEFIPE